MTGSGVAIRPLGPADAAPSAELHARLFDPAWSVAAFERLLGAGTTTAVAAAVEGSTGPADDRIVGAALAQGAAGEADILTVMVASEHRRLGIGRTLMCELERRLADTGVTRIVLEVARDNHAAAALYAALGFRAVAERRDYYGGGARRAEAAIVMEKPIIAAPVRPLAPLDRG